MTVFAIVPVHNRLNHTRDVLDCLRRQTYRDLHVVVVDDGSTDGTAEYLAEQAALGGVTSFRGDGNLWWGGAVQLALGTFLPRASVNDAFLLINNDTAFDADYVATLVGVSEALPDTVVGSILRHKEPPHRVLSIGPMLDIWGMSIWDQLRDIPGDELNALPPVYDVSALPGRGTLYPVIILRTIGMLRTRLLPHYFSDYELSARAKRHGYRTIVSTQAAVYSADEFGNETIHFSFLERHLSVRSAANIIHMLTFWSLTGNWQQRVTAIPRYTLRMTWSVWHKVMGIMSRTVRRMLRT